MERGEPSIAGDERIRRILATFARKAPRSARPWGSRRGSLSVVAGTRATWDAALDRMSRGLRRTIETHGPDSVAFYLSGQLLTEDYYVANKLMKGFIGSANVDTNSRLCMSSSVAGHRRASGRIPCQAATRISTRRSLLVLVGVECGMVPSGSLPRMIRARNKRGARIVTIDVRGTATTESADLALTIAPGMDGVLFSGLLVHFADNGFVNDAFAKAHTEGFDAALAGARKIAPDLPPRPENAVPRARISRLSSIFSRRWNVL